MSSTHRPEHPGPPLTLTATPPSEWRCWREIRLQSLRSDPDAFGSAWQQEQDFTEAQWRERLATSYGVLARVADGADGANGGDEGDGAVVGLGGLVTTNPGVSMVVAMWVHPRQRGRGVGRAVLEHLLGVVPDGHRLFLWVADGNPAVALYADLGFVATGAREPIRPGATLMKSEMELPRKAASATAASGDLGG